MKIDYLPFALSLSKCHSWFDKLTTNGFSCHVLLRKDVEGPVLSSWFDKLTTHGLTNRVA